MKKTYKEKYLELKMENKYLQHIISSKSSEIVYTEHRFSSLKNEFEDYKNKIEQNLLEEKKQAQKVDMILTFVFIGFLFVGIILKACGLF